LKLGPELIFFSKLTWATVNIVQTLSDQFIYFVVLESICGGSPVQRNLLFVQLPDADGSTWSAEGSDALIADTRFLVLPIISV
jgi:hypothetical protein